MSLVINLDLAYFCLLRHISEPAGQKSPFFTQPSLGYGHSLDVIKSFCGLNEFCLWVYIRFSVCPYVHPSICLSASLCSSVQQSVHQSVCPFVLPDCPSVLWSVHPSIQQLDHQSEYCSIRPSVCLSVCLVFTEVCCLQLLVTEVV